MKITKKWKCFERIRIKAGYWVVVSIIPAGIVWQARFQGDSSGYDRSDPQLTAQLEEIERMQFIDQEEAAKHITEFFKQRGIEI